ncbi:MAG: hypothetical protein IJU03_03140 [Thermoguttaceae bacterium]|nr:hypothetical protein [Thermoguttaceae bacterium]
MRAYPLRSWARILPGGGRANSSIGATWIAAALTLACLAYLGYAIYEYRTERLEDEDDVLCARRLTALLAFLSIEAWCVAALVKTEFFRYAWFQMKTLFGYGRYNHMALVVALGAIAVIAANIVVIARWIGAVMNRSAR